MNAPTKQAEPLAPERPPHPPHPPHLPPPHPRRRLPAEVLALAFILVAIGGLAAGFAWLSQLWPATGGDTLPEAAAEAIVSRGSELLGMAEPSAVWRSRLAAGDASLADYLLRIFVSPGYLARNAGDRAFAADASLVVTGTLMSEPDLDAAEKKLASGSRLAFINELLEQQGYMSGWQATSEPTRIKTLTLANDRPAAGTEIIGLLPVTAEARLTGSDARLKLYSDGFVRVSEAVKNEEPTLLSNYTVEWDTRQEQPGRHSLAFLVLTSDGRGIWHDLEYYEVPKVTLLQTGQVLGGSQAASATAWYQLPVQDGTALLTVVGSSEPLSLQLLDLHTRLLSRTESVAGQAAALRGLTADSDAYVRIETGTVNKTYSYQLAPAYAAASPLDDADRFLAVLQIKEQKILVQDESGARQWQDAGDYQVYDPTGRLSLLKLTLPDGSQAAVASAFDPDVSQYGLYVTAETGQLQLSTQVMEGSSAALQIELTTETGARQILKAGQAVPLALSENRLKLTVTAFDGSLRTYDISVLRPPQSAGYHKKLEEFPFSYRSSLWLMHVQWPAWQFLAAPAGVAWPAFIAAQDETDRSLVSSFSCPASWIEPGSPVYDGKSWKAATTKVISYFADPRNFLNDTDVFQFEKLTYDPAAHTSSGLAAMLGGTFMAPGNAQKVDYTAILAKAGETAGISPYYLASRILQEMGRTGESPLSTGTLAGYEGYYNFYNIGSTPDTSVPDGARINGARFAKYGREPAKGIITDDELAWLLPWRNPSDAIIGGAIWIAKSYIQIGQDTLYLQKFDLVKDGGYYTHQYAQNIQMAWSEARNTRKAYNRMGILGQAFVFSIPIFENQPVGPTSLP